MASTILNTYYTRKDENNPGLNLGKLGTWNTARGSDPLPYSDDAYELEEPAVKKLENEFGKVRYQLGPLGGGSPNAPGYAPGRTWSDLVPRE